MSNDILINSVKYTTINNNLFILLAINLYYNIFIKYLF